MPKTLILPWHYTDREMADYAAKYFAPHGVPADLKLERAPTPEPESPPDGDNLVACEVCEGEGYVGNILDTRQCDECKGTGVHDIIPDKEDKCPDCEDTGFIGVEPCLNCNKLFGI